MVAILNELGVEYSSFNILADQEVRQGKAKSRTRILHHGMIISTVQLIVLLFIVLLCGVLSSEDLLQLAHVPTAVCQWGTGRRTRYYEGT